MKILLVYPYFIHPRTQEADIAALPMGLYAIGGQLTAMGFDVEILNAVHMAAEPERFREMVLARRPQVIGFSILHGNRWGGIELARTAKAIDPSIQVVFGGVGATVLWENFLSHFPEIDYVVLGEGERSFPQLLTHLKKGTPQRPEAIHGLAFRKEGAPFCTAPAGPIEDLDTLADPARYFTFQHVALTRGCPENCAFCGSPLFWGRRVRAHSPEYLVRQMRRLYDRGVRFFYVSDDTFTLDRRRTLAVCRQIVDSGPAITWAAISRVDRVDEEVLLWMRRAGCIQVSYGIESGSPEIRRRLNKRIDPGQARKAFSLTLSMGILARAYFIYGCPGETDATIAETVAMMDAVKPLSAIFYLLEIFPGTALYRDYLLRTGQSEAVWLEKREGIAYFETDPDLEPERILGYGRQLREHFYRSLPGYVAAIELAANPELRPLHADFYARLGMTFQMGEYAAIASIPEKAAIARSCYEHALACHPHPRAFLGMGMLHQREKDFQSAGRVLEEGLRRFPDDPHLNLCMGINFMNMGLFKAARSYLLRAESLPETGGFIEQCEKAMNSA